MAAKPASRTNSQDYADWQLQHYASVGNKYGDQHFTQADSPYTRWILEMIASVSPNAGVIAEVGAGTCIFSSLLGKKMQLKTDVVCYEPVRELLDVSAAFDNVEAVCGDAVDFARSPRGETFDLVFTKDAAHHFSADTLDEVHDGICAKLKAGGRYLMVVRTPPRRKSVPVGSIARARWEQIYTPLSDLLVSMRRVSAWNEIQVTRWERAVDTSVREWLDGIRRRDSWSVFSALGAEEIAATVRELEEQFEGVESFAFVNQ
jgi:SAM-dependent methyltransferase